MISSLEKIKSMMVSACECAHEGHSDISLNLMELVREELANVTPSDLDAHFVISAVDADPFEDETNDILLQHDEVAQSQHGSSLAAILSKNFGSLK